MSNDLSLSRADLCMAASNVIFWAGSSILETALKFAVKTEILQPETEEDLFRSVFISAIALYSISEVAYSFANWYMIPRDASLTRKVISFPLFPNNFRIGNYDFYYLDTIKRISNLYAVAQNTVPKLSNCVRNFSKRPIRASIYGGVHVLNLFSASYHLVDSLGLFEKGFSFQSENKSYQSENESKQPPPNSFKPQENNQRMPDFEELDEMGLLTDPRLNPKRVSDAKKMFQLPEDHLREASKGACSFIRKKFREILLQVHPDHNSDPFANAASQNLDNAKETLMKAYRC